jgi:hypothetical protein
MNTKWMTPRARIDQILGRLNTRKLVLGLGFGKRAKLHAHSADIPCPVHDDADPSCSVFDTRDGGAGVRCHACGFSGTALHLIAAVLGLDIRGDFGRVVAAAEAMVGTGTEAPPPPRRCPPRLAEPAALQDEVFAAVVAPMLHGGRLDESRIAMDVTSYLRERALLDLAREDGWAALPRIPFQCAWVAMLFAAAEPCPGYAPPFTRRDVEQSGLVTGVQFSHPSNRLCIPWRTPEGVIYSLQRRRIDHGEPRYVGPRGRAFVWPFGIERMREAPVEAPIAFVEGAIDVLALRALCRARGEPTIVLGLPGVSAWRPSWATFARGRVAAVAVDTDAAGERVVGEMARDLCDAGARRIERWKAPAGDWADAAARRAS